MAADQDWRAYESQIFERLKALAGPDAEVTFDAKIKGRFSGVGRQVDVLVRGVFAGIGKATLAIDCKCFSKNVDVKNVETVMGLVDDVGTDIGLLITTKGFSPAAQRRAKGARRMWLEVVPYEDLADWQPDLVWCGICNEPHSDAFPGRCVHGAV